MKKLIIGLAVTTLACVAAHAALDASLLQNAVIVAPQATESTHTTTAMLAPTNITESATITGTIRANADYYGKGTVVLAFNGNDDAAYTNTAQLVTGTNSTFTGTVVATTIATHDADAIGIGTYQIDLDNLAGTHFAIRFIAVTGNAKATRFASALVHGATPSAAQTITSAAVDKMPFTGVANVVVAVAPPAKAATNYTAVAKIQHATTSGGDYTDVTGKTATITGATGGIATIPLDMTSGNRYLRAVVTTTNDVGAVSITINSYK